MSLEQPQQQPRREDQPPDWIDKVVRLAATIGLNPVRVRWKLQRWHHDRRSSQQRRERRSEHIRYRHKTCTRCGAVNDRKETRCHSCGEKLSWRGWQVLRRAGLTAPELLSVSALLGMAFVLAYGRVAVAATDGSIFSLPGRVLVDFGGHFPPYLEAGQWWRWLTAIYLHGGIWHIGFNLYALTIVGPHVEQEYGHWTALGLFVMTGVLGNIGSWGAGLYGVGIGASGGLMGLIGVTIGHAHRGGTSADRLLRNAMIKWCAYVFVFGWLIGADNWAHLFGLIPGAAFGYAVAPQLLSRGTGRGIAFVISMAGVIATLVALVLILFAPALIGTPQITGF
jgi:rhomboid protease GluP